MAKLTDQQKIDVVKEYLSGIGCKTLGKKYLISDTAILSILRKRGVKIRSHSEMGRKYTLNQHFFNKIDTEAKAYFLGLLYADGYNDEKRGAIHISLQERDKDILEKLNKNIESNKPLHFMNRSHRKHKNPHQNMYKIEINSKIMSTDLAKLGCIQKKSLILKFPTEEQVPKHLIHHFIRGYLDGDGCISIRNISIVSSKMFVEGLTIKLQELSIDTKSYCDKRGSEMTRELFLRTQIDCLKFLDFVYKDATIYLERKHKRALLFRESHEYKWQTNECRKLRS